MTATQEYFTLANNFSSHADFLSDWENFLLFTSTKHFSTPIHVEHYINGKQLACPMPLLKLKMAIKNTQVGNWVYLTATDPNSIQDIGAFCQHLGYNFDSFIAENGDKIFHILVQKTV